MARCCVSATCRPLPQPPQEYAAFPVGVGIAFVVAICAFFFRRVVLKRLAQRGAAANHVDAVDPPPDPEVLPDLEAPLHQEVLLGAEVNGNRFQRLCFWVLEVEGGFTLYRVCCRYHVEIMVHGTVETALRGAADLLRAEGRCNSPIFLARANG